MMFTFNVQLTKEQEKHQETVEWLFLGPRRTGRTVLMIMAQIKQAVIYPGMPIELIDHTRPIPDHHYLLRMAEGLIAGIEPKEVRNGFKLLGHRKAIVWDGAVYDDIIRDKFQNHIIGRL